MEMKAAHVLEGLQAGHAREVPVLTDELVARRSEAAEARQAAEAQRQREGALRWQAATLKGERDQALGELQTWAGSGWLRRLMGQPRLGVDETSGVSEPSGNVVVVPGDSA